MPAIAVENICTLPLTIYDKVEALSVTIEALLSNLVSSFDEKGHSLMTILDRLLNLYHLLAESCPDE